VGELESVWSAFTKLCSPADSPLLEELRRLSTWAAWVASVLRLE